MTSEEIKAETIRLYDLLPQDDEEARKVRIDIRDKVIELNYTFFGYVASHTFPTNRYITYEDKFQSALCHFCSCWHWYRFAKRYRTDLSFATFFKPRISEMIDREFTEVRYSVNRSLRMEVGEQIGKHWAQVRYEDLSDERVNITPDKMNSLKAIFGTLYYADIEDFSPYLRMESENYSPVEKLDDKYNTIEDLLIREMVQQECKLTDSKLLKLSDIYGIKFNELKDKLPIAESRLYKMCHDAVDINEELDVLI